MKAQSILLLCVVMATAGPVAAKRYFVSIPPDDDAKYKEANFAMWVPDEAATVRVVIVHQHGCGEPAETAGATATFDLQWQALARKWHGALMGANYRMRGACNDWCFPENGSEGAFLEALASFSEQSGHDEIKEVPWVLWGHSGGAEWVYRMFSRHPSRVLALVLRSGPAFMETTFLDSCETPVLYNLGAKEKEHERFGRIWRKAAELFEARRARGALDTWAPDPQSSHDCRFGRLLVIPYLDGCLAQRLGDPGGMLMASMDMSTAWFGNVETFEICPGDEYDADPTKAAWLPNGKIASAWKEFVATGWVADGTTPPTPTDLRASVSGPNEVTLRWRAQADLESGIKTFRIHRRDTGTGASVARNWSASPQGASLSKRTDGALSRDGEPFQKPNYHDTLDKPLHEMTHIDRGANPGTSYMYQVSAVNWSDLESPKSEPVTVATGHRP